jgi:hypothetical protein
MSEELVMKLTKIAIGVSLGLGGLAVNASDVAMFPYIVSSDAVTTIVTVVDRGTASTKRYNASGVEGGGSRLHWRLNYKTGSNLGNNKACEEVDYFLPTSPNDLQTVDIGGRLLGSLDTLGVLFNDQSINNNWDIVKDSGLTYALAAQVSGGAPLRGVLFVHNADTDASSQHTVGGEAMVYEFVNGAAWGYGAVENDGGGENDNSDFDFYEARSGYGGFNPAVTFMPNYEASTLLFVTPVNHKDQSMLGAGGGNHSYKIGDNTYSWNSLSATVMLKTSAGGAAGVAFDRDENLVSGSLSAAVKCVGAVNVQGLMTEGAKTVLQEGGYGYLEISGGQAIVQKLEYVGAIGNLTGTINGQDVAGASNNAFILQ